MVDYQSSKLKVSVQIRLCNDIYFKMATLQQITFSPRLKKKTRWASPKLNQNPQKKAICLRVLTISPKKPNSANRRVIKARFISSGVRLTAKIPGESHNLQQHSTVLIRGAKVKDLNMVKKHIKTTKEKKGGIVSKENFIHISNLKLISEKNKSKKIEVKK